MYLAKQDFKARLEDNKLVITLIGMSNIGKSYWSKQLTNLHSQRICCDDLIEERLAPELKKLGYSGIADVSRWMGQPYDERFTPSQKNILILKNQ